MIGRHDEVDLALPLDEALSLRHLMFVVRRHQGVVRFAALDLETPSGLSLESGQQARFVEAVGPLILFASDFVFFCVPTGQPLAWKPDATNPWATLLPRSTCRLEPVEPSTSSALIGTLEVRARGARKGFRLDARELGRGVLIGRASRCSVMVDVNSVSRVHAVVLSLDDQLFIIDSGSTNGLWLGDDEVKIAPFAEGPVFMLGGEVSVRWRASH
jgi:hypothetical protein